MSGTVIRRNDALAQGKEPLWGTSGGESMAIKASEAAAAAGKRDTVDRDRQQIVGCKTK